MKKPKIKTLISSLGYVHIFVLAVVAVFLVFSARADEMGNMEPDYEKEWGIRVLSLTSTAADYMLDFRYRVIDPAKAETLFRRGSRPQLIDQESGAQMGVYSSPKTGPLRTTNKPKAGRNYAILFANPGRYIKVGSKVTITIDDFRAENLTVQ